MKLCSILYSHKARKIRFICCTHLQYTKPSQNETVLYLIINYKGLPDLWWSNNGSFIFCSVLPQASVRSRFLVIQADVSFLLLTAHAPTTPSTIQLYSSYYVMLCGTTNGPRGASRTGARQGGSENGYC